MDNTVKKYRKREDIEDKKDVKTKTNVISRITHNIWSMQVCFQRQKPGVISPPIGTFISSPGKEDEASQGEAARSEVFILGIPCFYVLTIFPPSELSLTSTPAG